MNSFHYSLVEAKKIIYEAAQTALPNKEIRAIELTPTLTIPAGETLHVRVLPWHEHTSGSGKYILLRDVVIEGQAFETETAGVESIQPSVISSQKVLENNVLYIIKNGVKYNVQGQIVK